MKETEAAWFAGVLDSDGHIGIYRNTGTTQRHRTPRFTPSLVIVNTSEAMMVKLSSLWPQSTLRKRKRLSEKHQQTYTWRATETTIPALLATVGPYLVAKTEQASLMLEFLSTRKRFSLMGHKLMPVEEALKREAFWKRMMALNSPLATRND